MLDRSRVRFVYAEVAETPQTPRPEALDRLCAGDAQLRSEVESLLSAAARRPDLMGAPAPDPPAGEAPGNSVGPYRLLEEIGHGGFGTVYMAEQSEPISRRVAVKVIKLGMDTRAVIARFEAERQALAMMDHPHIARVLDAGATAAGRPFFVMELVRGEPITRFADGASLSITDRLLLFIQICQAVQHAHSKGVIHRDLKPGNILVAVQDGRPHAKVIDFGIAKATSGPLTDRTFFTEFRQFLGTPEYMSPEQTLGSGGDLDTRSDVYSLGVVLYELMTGTTPVDPESLRSADFAEVPRIIRESETPRPSKRLSTLSTRAQVAALRRTEPRRLGLLLRGDLDWIVLKALEKDRSRRYETVAALSEDVGRFLEHQPVSAAPPSAAYRVRKFVARHRVGVLAAGLVTLALTAGLAGTSIGLYRANEQRERAVSAEERQSLLRQRAERERDEAQRITQFLQMILRSDDPRFYTTRDDVTLRQAIDGTLRGLDAGVLRDTPGLECGLRLTFARTFVELSRYADAKAQVHIAQSLMRPEPADSHERALAWTILAAADFALGDLKSAETHYRMALSFAESQYGADDIESARSRLGLGVVLTERDRTSEARDLVSQGLAALRAAPRTRASTGEIIQAMAQLALLASKDGDRAGAVDQARQALAFAASARAEDLPQAISARTSLGVMLIGLDQLDECQTVLESALERSRRVLGAQHAQTGTVLYSLGMLERARGRHAESEALFRQAMDIVLPARGETSISAIRMRQALAGALESQKKLGEAVAVRQLIDRTLPDNSPLCVVERVQSLESLALDYRDLAQQAAAEEVFRHALAIAEAHWPDGHPNAWLRIWMAGSLGNQIAFYRPAPPDKRVSLLREAEPLITACATDMKPPPGDGKYRPWALQRVVLLYEWLDKREPNAGHAEKAAQWRAVAAQTAERPR